MQSISKLGIGPLSKQIIKAAYSYSQSTGTPLMLISSKNQIDFDRGYVFTTRGYRTYLDSMKAIYPQANVIICRDHCGPGHNSIFDVADTYKTIDADLESGFDLIHIDFCFHQGSYQDILTESKKAIQYIQKHSPRTMLEIGTDENTGSNIENVARVEEQMKYFTAFCQPQFFVCQTGTIIKEINQVGMFHEDYVQKLKLVADKYHLLIKEHNADYLSRAELQKRRGLIGAVNVAPQYGVLQTQLTLFKAYVYGLDTTDFLNVAYRSRKWEKWMHNNTADNKFLCSVIAGHYNFNDDSYKKLFEQISEHEDFETSIEQEMHKQFALYLNTLNTVNIMSRTYTSQATVQADNA